MIVPGEGFLLFSSRVPEGMVMGEIDTCIISGEKQVRFCGFKNCEFFGVNTRNELLKYFIIGRDNVINVIIYEIAYSSKLSFDFLNESI